MAAVLMAVVGSMYLNRGMALAVDVPLADAIESVGGKVDMVTIDMWGRFDHLAGDEAKKSSLATSVAVLGGECVSSYEEVRGGGRMIRRACRDGEAKMAVVVAENQRAKDGKEVCLSVRLTGARDDLAELMLQAGEITTIGENFGGNMARNTCLRGLISGKLKCKEKTDYVEKILSHLGAQMITIQKREQYVTCTAYAPQLGEAVQVSGGNVNLNIILRDSGENTWVYLGTPLLMMEY